jgi:CRISPR-associated protein Cmr4
MTINNEQKYLRQRYLLMTTDPVHIGTGGYRLGRVDNSIIREPGTRVPKIPGTSLHGAARAYAAQLYETPGAAGQSQDKIDKPDENPVCYTFGYIKQGKSGNEEKTIAYSGVVNLFDAQVLLFPVYSMAGPVWVGTISRLQDAGITVDDVSENWESSSVLTSWDRTDPLNLGWMMVGISRKVTITPNEVWQNDARWSAISNRIVLVHDALFSHVVNSNLEVRTSVAIDPYTGAAVEGALYTYEALPRTTFLTMEVISDDYRKGINGRPFPKTTTFNNNPLPGGPWENPLNVVTSGLRMIEWLGVGGMGTRGFGRVAMIGNPLDISLNDLLTGATSHEQSNDESH